MRTTALLDVFCNPRLDLGNVGNGVGIGRLQGSRVIRDEGHGRQGQGNQESRIGNSRTGEPTDQVQHEVGKQDNHGILEQIIDHKRKDKQDRSGDKGKAHRDF